MRVSRIMLMAITVIGMIIAWNENSVIFEMTTNRRYKQWA